MSTDNVYDAIANAGYTAPEQIVWDSKLHRFATDPAKKHSKDGWYIAHDDSKGKIAQFGSFRDGGNHIWNNGSGRKLTEAEIKEIEAQKKKALADEKKTREQSALRAQRIYTEAATDVDFSAYLKRKGIDCPDGVRAVQGLSSKAFGFDGAEWSISGLVVPMCNKAGEIRSLQLIPEDEGKKKLFMKGGQVAACFHALGGEIGSAKRILIAEGLATAQSARAATGDVALVAFSAGNLPAIAEIARSLNATAEIVLLADDDEAGRTKAEQAAKASGGRVVLPGSGVNDFNDLHRASGLAAVKLAILGPDLEEDEEESDGDWKADLIVKHKDNGDQIIPCRVHNLMTILRHAPEFKGRVRMNTFSAQVAIDGKDLDDVGPIELKATLERHWIKEKVPTGDVIEALTVVASREPYHPIREYLDALQWDKIERIQDFFADHFGCSKDPYHMAVAISLFVSAVARVYKPGAKVDTMVILESIQGIGKTKLWLAIFGEWCAEVTSSLNDKDFFSGLRGVWCADFGELDQFSKAETTRIKQVITQTFDHYRPHYGRAHQRFPRQCVFVGGTNQDNWQTDASGARRFLPVRVNHAIDVDAIAAIRDQLWAEAVVRFKRGESWWNIPDAAEHQEQSYAGDPWEGPIHRHLTDLYQAVARREYGALMETTTEYVLLDVLKMDFGKQTRREEMRVSAILKRAGWERRKKGKAWRYVPSDQWLAEKKSE